MSRLVADASVALVWCFPDESDAYADQVLESLKKTRLVVPAHWSLEVANAFLTAERRGRTRPADTARAVALLGNLPIDVDARTAEKALSQTLSLGTMHRLTAYDAAYLELCLREGLPLATLDRNLIAACAVTGVVVFQPA